MKLLPLGHVVRSFFEDHLKVQRGLRPSSIKSYRDTLRLFLGFTSKAATRPIVRLSLNDLTLERVLSFLAYIEKERGNHIRSRNQRLAALKTFFAYIAFRVPEMLETCQRIDKVPVKRTPPPETHYLEREDVALLLKRLPTYGGHALRDRTIILFLYNTGARVQEVADLKVGNLDLSNSLKVQLNGKGNKWRTCPLWEETVTHLKRLLNEKKTAPSENDPVFCSYRSLPLTRFGIYKIIRRHASILDKGGARPKKVTPHLFRHTAAVHLLESGVEVNVIRGWLGHVSIDTTNRYAELTIRAKELALRKCEPKLDSLMACRSKKGWRDDKELLNWLESL